MKHLTFVRHAKSSWKDSNLADHARPLNGRGRRVAPRIAAKLADVTVEQAHVPGRIVTSDALRAVGTAKILQAAFAERERDVPLVELSELYLADEDTFFECVWALPEDALHVVFVGHNPGMHDFVNQLLGKSSIDAFPTCAVAMLRLDVQRWPQVMPGTAKLDALWIPKQLGYR